MLKICSCDGCNAKSSGGRCLAQVSRLRWYAVQCLANREFVAASQLRNQGFVTFLPCQLRTRRHARKFDSVRRPLFPGYLFVQLDLAHDRWRSVNGTLGVAKLVSHAELPSAAPTGSIEAIRAACDTSDIMHISSDVAPGDAVRVTCGPFSELIGKLERLDGGRRVRVLLELMGRRTSVALPRDQIVPELVAA